jgi:hypothetical protein
MEIRTEAAQFLLKEYINGIFIAGHSDAYLQINGTKINVLHIKQTFIKVTISYLKVTQKLENRQLRL